ncbi:MAG: cardiolipin synthase [Bacteroidales bacterium]|nr:cardiolipin synthase [Bacteroidales bacterium]
MPGFIEVISNIITNRYFIASVVIVLNLIAFVYIIWRSQGVERTLSWLFAVIAFPVLGALMFFILTHQPIKQSKKRKRKVKKIVGSTTPDIPLKTASTANGQILNLAYAVSGYEASYNNNIEILTEDTDAFKTISKKVQNARKFIWVEYYIIKKDETGRRFMKLLADIASTGIEVRVLFDAYGSWGLDPKSVKEIKDAGGKVETFNPFNPFRSRWSFHLRNHRKLIVIDGEIAFTGGMNISDEYSGRNRRRGLEHFRDTHLMVSGDAVNNLANVFREDWAYATGGEVLPEIPTNTNETGESTVAVLPSDPDQFQNATAMVFFEALNNAKKSILLTSPYFIPDEPIIRALECAALRGVDVKIIVPFKSDVLLAHLAAVSYYAQLIPLGVKVYEYKPSMLHAKTLIIDDNISIVGSANMDIRSFRLNFELNVLIIDEKVARELKNKFMHDLQNSKYIDPLIFSKRGLRKRMVERLTRLLSPLL